MCMLPWSKHFCKQNVQQLCWTYIVQDHMRNFLCNEMFDWEFWWRWGWSKRSFVTNKWWIWVENHATCHSSILGSGSIPSYVYNKHHLPPTKPTSCLHQTLQSPLIGLHRHKNTTVALHKLHCGSTEIRATLLTNQIAVFFTLKYYKHELTNIKWLIVALWATLSCALMFNDVCWWFLLILHRQYNTYSTH